MNAIRMNNVSFSYGNVKVFDKYDLCLNNYKSYSIIGPSSCGKTTLLKLMSGVNKDYKGEINVNYINIFTTDFKLTKKYIVYICDDDLYVRNTLKEELMFSMENQGYMPKDIMRSIKYVEEYFDLSSIMNKEIKTLSKEQRLIVKLLSYVVTVPSIMALDDLFKWLSPSFKEKFVRFLEEQDITLVNVVSDMEDVLYTDYLVVLMNNGNIAIEGATIPVLKEEKLIKRLGFNLPFMVDLSIQLKYYDLIDDIYLDKKELINKLWK